MTTINTQTVKAQSLLASDTVVFFDTEYKVKSCLVYPHLVEVIYHDTNDGQPYIYGKDEEVEKVV